MRENVKCYAIRIIVHNKKGFIFNGAVRIKRSYFQSLTMTDIYRDLSGKGSQIENRNDVHSMRLIESLNTLSEWGLERAVKKFVFLSRDLPLKFILNTIIHLLNHFQKFLLIIF